MGMAYYAGDLARLIALSAAANERTDHLFGLAGTDIEHDALAIVGRDEEPTIVRADGGGEEFAPLNVVPRKHPHDGASIRHKVSTVRSWDHYHRVGRRVQVHNRVNALRSNDRILILNDCIRRGRDGRVDLADRFGRLTVPDYHAPVRTPGDHRQETIRTTLSTTNDVIVYASARNTQDGGG